MIDQFEEQRFVQFEQLEKENMILRANKEEVKRLQQVNRELESRITMLEERDETNFNGMVDAIDNLMNKLFAIQKQILTTGLQSNLIEQRNKLRHETIKSILKLEQLPFLKYVAFRKELELDQQQEITMQEFVSNINDLVENLKEIHLDLEINQLSMSQKKNIPRLNELHEQKKKLEAEIAKLEKQVEPNRDVLQKNQLRQSNAFGFAECSFILSLMKS